MNKEELIKNIEYLKKQKEELDDKIGVLEIELGNIIEKENKDLLKEIRLKVNLLETSTRNGNQYYHKLAELILRSINEYEEYN